MSSPPVITVTDAAASAFRSALEEGDSNDVVHITIDSSYRNDLYVGPPDPGDLILSVNGISVALDAKSARRANGLTIDFVDGATGAGFKLENPNDTPLVRGARPADLLKWLDEDRRSLDLIDVRSAEERKRAFVDLARVFDEACERELLAMPKDRKMVFMGHHSPGGREVAKRFYDQGFTNAQYVVGGIDAWSTWDPNIPRY